MTNLNVTPLDQHTLYMLLFNLILRHDDRLRLDVIEAIRKILQNPITTHSFSPALQDTLRSLRDDLLASPNQSIASTLSQPPARPVK